MTTTMTTPKTTEARFTPASPATARNRTASTSVRRIAEVSRCSAGHSPAATFAGLCSGFGGSEATRSASEASSRVEIFANVLRDGAAMSWRRYLLVVGAVTVMAALGVAVTGAAEAAAAPPASVDRSVIRGRAPLTAWRSTRPTWRAVVERQGLVTPCQLTLPKVRAGRYVISVYAWTEAAGCGAPGADIFLWTFVQGQVVFGRAVGALAGSGATTRFLPTFATADPDGGVGPTVGFAGEVLDQYGRRLPPGTRLRGVHRHDPLRSRLHPADRQLHRLQHRRGRPRFASRMRPGRDHRLPRQRPARRRDRGQRTGARRVARPVPRLTSSAGALPGSGGPSVVSVTLAASPRRQTRWISSAADCACRDQR